MLCWALVDNTTDDDGSMREACALSEVWKCVGVASAPDRSSRPETSARHVARRVARVFPLPSFRSLCSVQKTV